MSIIKSLQNYLLGFDQMRLRPIGEIRTDMTEGVGTYALAPTGNNIMTEDILGNRTYKNSYVFYAKEAAADEIDRQDNYDFLDALQEWLDDQAEDDNLPILGGSYVTESLEVSNAMLMDIEEDGTGLYQVQIQLIFTKKRKV